jgi:hypothetical protein
VKSHVPTRFLAGFGLALVLAACGSDSGDSDNTADADAIDAATTTAAPVDTAPETAAADSGPTDAGLTSTPTTSTTATSTVPATTTTSRPFVSGTITTGTVSDAAGTTVAWALTGAPGELCFDAELNNAAPTDTDPLGAGVSDCLRPAGGIDDLDGALSVSIGVVDGDRTFGYLWGRVDATIVSLSIEHVDGSQTIVDVFDGPSGSRVFAVVIDTTKGPPVESLDAVSGTQIEASQPIRVFLRSGPTYPVTPSTTTTPVDLYPTVS